MSLYSLFIYSYSIVSSYSIIINFVNLPLKEYEKHKKYRIKEIKQYKILYYKRSNFYTQLPKNKGNIVSDPDQSKKNFIIFKINLKIIKSNVYQNN
ncbi:hypothetical protein pb186bvf_010872 [Paramecium bursaria]